MESNVNYNPTEIRYSHGRLLGQKRQMSDKEAKSPAVTNPTLAEVKAKMASGQKLTNEETQVLLDNIKKTEAEYAARRKNAVAELNMRNSGKSAKTELPPKTYTSESDQYLQQREKIRQLENSASKKCTGYRHLDNNPKGGFECAMDKMRQLGETKAELTEKSAKIAKIFAKILEFLKKYGKSIKA